MVHDLRGFRPYFTGMNRGSTGVADMVRMHRINKVSEVTGMSKSTIYDLMAKGLFPRPVKLTGKAVAWRENVVQEWLDSRPTA